LDQKIKLCNNIIIKTLNTQNKEKVLKAVRKKWRLIFNRRVQSLSVWTLWGPADKGVRTEFSSVSLVGAGLPGDSKAGGVVFNIPVCITLQLCDY